MLKLCDPFLFFPHGYCADFKSSELPIEEILENTPLVTLKQQHGNKVFSIEDAAQNLEGDGLVTNKQGLALGILTADCVPILWEDPINKVIGACHAGWKGAFHGIIEQTIKAMETLGAKRSTLRASLGPAIFQKDYEVDEIFYQNFLDKDLKTEAFFKKAAKKGHYLFDLPGFVKEKIHEEGVVYGESCLQNTFDGPHCSRRRVGGAGYGHNLSFIRMNFS